MKRYIRASFTSEIPEWLKKDKSALSALNRAGIDLHNATFSKEREGKMKDNYAVYLIKQPAAYQQRTSYKKDNPDAKINYNVFIWIPGVYNDDHYVSYINYNRYDPYMHDYKTSDKAVKYFSKKDLNIVDTVYIYSGGDNIKSPREHYQDPRHDKYGRYVGQQMIPESWNWNGNERETVPAHWSEQGTYYGMYDRNPSENSYRDKSGYEIPNPKKRLQKFYDSQAGMDRRVKSIRAKIDPLYKQLGDLKERVFNSIIPEGSLNDYRRYSSLYQQLGYAIENYEAALENLEKLDKYGWKGNSWSSSNEIERALSYIERSQRYIDDLNSTLDQQEM